MDIGQPAPHERSDGRSGQRDQRQQRGFGLGDRVFRGKPRQHEAERGGLHHIDDEAERQHQQGRRVPASERRAVRRFVIRPRFIAVLPPHLGQRAETGKRHADRDQRHAQPHAVVHRHALEVIAHGMRHCQHRQVQQHTRADRRAPRPEERRALPDN